MDVEPCYPLFSAELESAEALASSQQKFQTLNSNGPCHGDDREEMRKTYSFFADTASLQLI